MAKDLTVADLRKITPQGNKYILEQTVEYFNQYAEEFGLTTALRKSHFLAQIAHESAHFTTTKELGGQSYLRGKRYFPFYGRGLIQCTWEYNYAEFYEWCVERGLNPPEFFRESKLDVVAEFPYAFFCAVWYWDKHNLNRLADDDNVRAITKKINGGYNGLDDRITKLNAAKGIWKVKINKVDTDVGSITEKKYSVRDVQEALVSHGMDIEVDGKMGEQTVTAVKLFQKLNDLVPDGIIGKLTAEKLFI